MFKIFNVDTFFMVCSDKFTLAKITKFKIVAFNIFLWKILSTVLFIYIFLQKFPVPIA